jgi:hypothetical protein
LRGVLATPCIPVFVVLTTFIGFGALAQGVGLSFIQVVFISISVFALPGQVVLVDQSAPGGGLIGNGFCRDPYLSTVVAFDHFTDALSA